jgi:hypothetical protein
MSSSEAGQVIGWILVLALALWVFYFFQKPIALFVRSILTGTLAVVLVCLTWFLYIAAIVVPVFIVWHLMVRATQ